MTGFPVVVLDLAGTPPPQSHSTVPPAPTSTQHCRFLTATAASKHCPAFALPASPRQSSRSATLSKWERRLESRSPFFLSFLYPHPLGAAKGCTQYLSSLYFRAASGGGRESELLSVIMSVPPFPLPPSFGLSAPSCPTSEFFLTESQLDDPFKNCLFLVEVCLG